MKRGVSGYIDIFIIKSPSGVTPAVAMQFLETQGVILKYFSLPQSYHQLVQQIAEGTHTIK